jgi:hypothetical protein
VTKGLKRGPILVTKKPWPATQQQLRVLKQSYGSWKNVADAINSVGLPVGSDRSIRRWAEGEAMPNNVSLLEAAIDRLNNGDADFPFHNLFEILPTPTIVHADFRIEYANAEARSLSGEKLIGSNPLDFIEPEHRDCVRERWQIIYEGGRVDSAILSLELATSRRTIIMSSAHLKFKATNYAVCTAIDITGQAAYKSQLDAVRTHARQLEHDREVLKRLNVEYVVVDIGGKLMSGNIEDVHIVTDFITTEEWLAVKDDTETQLTQWAVHAAEDGIIFIKTESG